MENGKVELPDRHRTFISKKRIFTLFWGGFWEPSSLCATVPAKSWCVVGNAPKCSACPTSLELILPVRHFPSSCPCGTQAPCAEQAALCRQIPPSAIDWFKLRGLGATAREEIPVHLLTLENCLVAFLDMGLPPPQSAAATPSHCSEGVPGKPQSNQLGFSSLLSVLFFPWGCCAAVVWSSREMSQVELSCGSSFTMQGHVPTALSRATSWHSAFVGHRSAVRSKRVLWHFTGLCSSSSSAKTLSCPRRLDLNSN